MNHLPLPFEESHALFEQVTVAPARKRPDQGPVVVGRYEHPDVDSGLSRLDHRLGHRPGCNEVRVGDPQALLNYGRNQGHGRRTRLRRGSPSMSQPRYLPPGSPAPPQSFSGGARPSRPRSGRRPCWPPTRPVPESRCRCHARVVRPRCRPTPGRYRTPGERNLSVHDHQLPVIPLEHAIGIAEGGPVEGAHLDPCAAERPPVPPRCRPAPHPIIQDPYLDSLASLFKEDIPERPPYRDRSG